MTIFRDFEPGFPIPAWFVDAVQEYLQGSSWGFAVRVKPGSPNTLQVPASAGDGRASIAIESRWRYAEAPVESTSSGGAGTRYVWVTTGENSNTTDAGPPLHEVDTTNYSFALAITTTDVAPSGPGIARTRKVATAQWSGSDFASVTPIVETRLALAESLHLVNDPGEPAIGGFWTADPSQQPRFWKDAAGVVHVAGTATTSVGSWNEIFQLPPSYRPLYNGGQAARGMVIISQGGNVFPTQVVVSHLGQILVWLTNAPTSGSRSIHLDGLRFDPIRG